jgi:plasmid stabilization system protein ParE
MKGYELTDEALLDLQEIWVYIAKDNPVAADKLEADIYKACELLAKNPRLGHKRLDLTDEPYFSGRFAATTSSSISASQPLKVARVLHAGRDAKNSYDLQLPGGPAYSRKVHARSATSFFRTRSWASLTSRSVRVRSAAR